MIFFSVPANLSITAPAARTLEGAPDRAAMARASAFSSELNDASRALLGRRPVPRLDRLGDRRRRLGLCGLVGLAEPAEARMPAGQGGRHWKDRKGRSNARGRRSPSPLVDASSVPASSTARSARSGQPQFVATSPWKSPGGRSPVPSPARNPATGRSGGADDAMVWASSRGGAVTNARHLEFSASPEWRRLLEDTFVPRALAKVDLGPNVVEIGPGPDRPGTSWPRRWNTAWRSSSTSTWPGCSGPVARRWPPRGRQRRDPGLAPRRHLQPDRPRPVGRSSGRHRLLRHRTWAGSAGRSLSTHEHRLEHRVRARSSSSG